MLEQRGEKYSNYEFGPESNYISAETLNFVIGKVK